MSARNISREARVHQQRAAYKEAFDEWAYAITRLQLVTRSPAGGDAIKEARQRAAAAYASYRETRDLLASSLVEMRGADPIQVKVLPFKTVKSGVHQ